MAFLKWNERKVEGHFSLLESLSRLFLVLTGLLQAPSPLRLLLYSSGAFLTGVRKGWPASFRPDGLCVPRWLGQQK